MATILVCPKCRSQNFTKDGTAECIGCGKKLTVHPSRNPLNRIRSGIRPKWR